MREFRENKETWDRYCHVALLPGKQLVLVNDPLFEAPGYAVLIPNQKHTPTRKTHAPIANVFKTFTLLFKMKTSTWAKQFLAPQLALIYFGHVSHLVEYLCEVWLDSQTTIIFAEIVKNIQTISKFLFKTITY